MKNKKYEAPLVEIIKFNAEDVIATSDNGFDGEVDHFAESW